nr:MAG TPA: hypothetical protein [Ackermannviridae sp.]
MFNLLCIISPSCYCLRLPLQRISLPLLHG